MKEMAQNPYDVLIIGAGTAGLAASMYAGRYLLRVGVISRDFGGLGNWAHLVENYPGFPTISGPELMAKFKDHAEKSGASFIQGGAKEVKREGEKFLVRLADETLSAKSLLIATGTVRRKLNVPGEDKFLGKGVSYCATCDAPFFKGKETVIVGGGDAAGTGALLAAQYATKVYLIARNKNFEDLKVEPVTREAMKKEPKIEFIYENEITEIRGEETVKSITLKKPYKESKELQVEGVFVEIGGSPNTEIAKKLGAICDEMGYIKVDDWQRTNIPGLFAAGDVTDAMAFFDQFVTAAAEGSLAAAGIYQYLRNGLMPSAWSHMDEPGGKHVHATRIKLESVGGKRKIPVEKN
jgi:thioredoxin reductase (NADPH)